jgi:hypothetical protein
MGIGTGIFLIAVGAILLFAVQADLGWLNLDVVGLVLIGAGIAVIALTVWFWRDRRRRVAAPSLVEETRVAHSTGTAAAVPVDPPYLELPPTGVAGSGGAG